MTSSIGGDAHTLYSVCQPRSRGFFSSSGQPFYGWLGKACRSPGKPALAGFRVWTLPILPFRIISLRGWSL